MKRQSGFTLVEILVVIAIMAAMISILLPALAHSRQMAYRITCLNNLKQLGVTVETYSQAYGCYPVCVPPDANEKWNDFLADKSIAVKKMLGVPVSLWPFHKSDKLYNCPVLRRFDCDISYCYNWLAGRKLAADEDLPMVGPSDIPIIKPEEVKFHLLRPEKVKSPAIFVLLYDQPVKPEKPAASPAGHNPYKDIDPDDYESIGSKMNGQGYLWTYEGSVGPHTEGYDILFADGHVQWHKRWSGSSISRNPF
jgi:prepilin-type N-terminal cleavage/methylation domain-containing protein/prepilin-type processing-associated H-X9-DG protein